MPAEQQDRREILPQRQVIDCKGMQCPAPILQVAKAAREIGKRPAVLEVIVDDGDFPRDVQAWCRSSKSQLIDLAQSQGIYVATIGLNGASVTRDATPQSGMQPAITARPPSRPTPPAPPQAVATLTETLDCRGMQCPAPILALAKVARGMGEQPGFIELLADDADFPRDLKAWCRATRNEMAELAATESGDHTAVVAINGAVATAPPPVVQLDEEDLTVIEEPETEMPSSLDLRGLRAPEPMRQLSLAFVESPGAILTVHADEPGFLADVMGWARATGVAVLSVEQHGTESTVQLQLGQAQDIEPSRTVSARPAVAGPPTSPSGLALAPPTPQALATQAVGTQALGPRGAPERESRCTLLVIHNDFESLMAALMCANTAAAQGMDAAIVFSFWGVNLLRADKVRANVAKKKTSILQRMMHLMMPKGPRRQKMGQMHMGGMGLGMMKHFMRKNNVMGLDELLASAVQQDVKFVICTMSLGIMGIQERDLMDLPNIEYGGVTSFVEMSQRSSLSLVF